jgi:hypothetical protein
MDRLVLKAYNYNYLLQPVRGRKRKTGTHWRVRNEDMIWNANFQPLTQAQRVAAVVNEIVVWDGANPGDYGLHGAFRNALRAQFRVNAAAGAAILGPIAF